MVKTFIHKIKETQKPLIGTIITLDVPEISEILSSCGFDWLFYDMEHSGLSIKTIRHCMQAVRGDCSPLIRVPNNDFAWIKLALDAGCEAVIVPQVNSKEEAEKAVQAAKYPPAGERGVGGSRAHGYGLNFQDYVHSANQDIALIIQIEHKRGVENLDCILEVEGLDAIFIGPYDLSASLGVIGEIQNEKVQEQITKIKEKCKQKSIPVGIFVKAGEEVRKEYEEGCSFIIIGSDASFLISGAKANLKLAHNNILK